ncbi:UDP-N-acetylmuramoyl-tripeptide--D-alanyl-D-alanine ligase [Leptobacterium flavescens]|uniref:UDP-N-acetylmuramoyl-tripeptide--D-alanyl-D-alanine ligase n=1 Tax=Leptobacterium flavescens TaxID=472055 RepID=A0A6P0UT45_9FLAO|nr:UDP-N-acetylmuramoyl-tripeptide--D-alanyl-D-alanine ligase [Leptobacterium flavescens]NER14999.1 UDP-N-acetylmuramoyl-tripeptide--D-alanyl-D-alanine ligase [Leptobacterium flavescens]
MNTEGLHSLFLEKRSISTDSRKIEENTIFFALKGENFNGNTFARQALEKGASYAVIDEAEYKTSDRILLVDDVLTALQQLANFHRKHLGIPILSLTGSNGKTTTKELINSVLSRKFKTTATLGNLNNHIGVPLTLLSMDKTTEFGIVEMGANHQKEIEFLCGIAEPNYGCITNFGKAHLEGFGGVEGVIRGKSELYDHLINENGFVFYNNDDPIQSEKLKDISRKFGFDHRGQADVHISLLSADPFVKLEVRDEIIESHLIGSYNYNNIALAVCIGTYFDIPLPEIKAAIESYTPQNNRSQIINKNSNKIILDAYNANPSSMNAALENFSGLSGTKKTALLGDMFELGSSAAEEHQKIAEMAEKLENTEVFLVGVNFFDTNTSLRKFKSYEELRDFMKDRVPDNSTILIKGSRGMALERILDIL